MIIMWVMTPQHTIMERAIRSGKIVDGMTFTQQVWAMTVQVPAGRVTTYGEIARKLGRPRGARAVGQALHRNPYAPQVPCHRVVGSAGQLTGFAGGLAKKAELLEAEGVAVDDHRVALDEYRV